MATIGQILREIREKNGMSLRKVALLADIDVAVLSKMERGQRRINKTLILKLAKIYKVNPDDLMVQFLGDKVLYDLKDEDMAAGALKVAEKSIQYKKVVISDLKEIIEKSRTVLEKDDRIDKAWIFGSYARQEQRAESDLDVMIKIRGGEKFSLFDFSEVQFQLENVLRINVDIVEEDALSSFVQETIIAERILIYER
jgi:predicted nucleotidyltransferase